MAREHETSTHPDRRDVLKTAGAVATGALLLPRLEAPGRVMDTEQSAIVEAARRAERGLA